MKTKILTVVVVSVIVTLSLAFASPKENAKKAKSQSTDSRQGNAPAGGFAIEDQL